ncbi:MAG TPA: aminotransferase class I/II-fold pyridoxal phosphate-dependent enzyme [Thermoanaerobaculia bacterium]|nr:aminotransferase class I/II-fold pyridoxal phosphate-dependent enzyme [Thermoanaerobaculia bacterium]
MIERQPAEESEPATAAGSAGSASTPGAAPAAYPLELSGTALRRLVDAAMDRIAPHIDSLPLQPAADADGAAPLARSLVEPLPEHPAPLGEVLDLLFERAVPRSFNTAGPGYLAYIPGGGLLHAAVADLIADAVNRYVGVFAAAPALSQLEANVLAWFAGLAGYPKTARGVLTSGGSLANFTAVVTARRERLPEQFLAGTLYASDQAHHSVQKAALLAGFPPGSVRAIASDAAFRLRPDLLAAAIAEDRRQGRLPFMVVANAGSTNTGAVDPLAPLADLCAREGLWLHIDAAYGGFFLLTERGRRALAGIERADSIVLDPHKSLFLPYGTGALLVRDGAALRRAHGVTADYMPPLSSDDELIDFCEISPELSRPFRGLRVWLALKLLGAAPFRDALDEKLDLAHWAAGELRAMPEVEILAEPQLSLFAFRLAPRSRVTAGAGAAQPQATAAAGAEDAGDAHARLNRLNRDWLARVNARRRVYLTGTMLGGRFALRICVLSFRTHRDRVEQAIEDLRAAAREALAGI